MAWASLSINRDTPVAKVQIPQSIAGRCDPKHFVPGRPRSPESKCAGKILLRKRGFPLTSAFLMAKTSWINRNNRKRKTVEKYAGLRAELKAKKDYIGLSQLPRDASPTRVVNRCQVTGRRRAFIRRFKISRLTFRELASAGLIPGVTKSSW